MTQFDAFENVEVPKIGQSVGVQVDERRGDTLRSKLCVRPFNSEERRDDIVAGHPRHFVCEMFDLQSRCGNRLGSTHVGH